jgi:sialidase-1
MNRPLGLTPSTQHPTLRHPPILASLLILPAVWSLFIQTTPLTTTAAPAPTTPEFTTRELFRNSRFPNLVITPNGSLLAFCAQNQPLSVRRSEDGGEVWSQPIPVSESPAIMGAAVADETTGDVLVFDHFLTHRGMFRSRDDGRTWQREDVTIRPDRLGGVGVTHGAEAGITLRSAGHKGRLLLPARVFGPENSNDQAWWPYHYNTAIYSDDRGRSWQTSHPFPVLGTGEGALVELADGSIYYNSRCHMANDAHRRIAWSHDGGATWINPTTSPELPDGMRATRYGCMAGLTRLPLEHQDILLYSNLDSDQGHDLWAGRRNITVWLSPDGGRSWPVKRLVYDGPSAYSSLAAGRPGTPTEGWIYLLYEGGPRGQHTDIYIARFNRPWLTP